MLGNLDEVVIISISISTTIISITILIIIFHSRGRAVATAASAADLKRTELDDSIRLGLMLRCGRQSIKYLTCTQLYFTAN